MRQTYGLTDETFKVLSDHLGEFAYESGKDISYFNRIKNGGEPDRFAQFFYGLFVPGCMTTAPVELWINRINAHYARTRKLTIPKPELAKILLEKIQSDSDALSEIVGALADNKLDAGECHAILAKLKKNKEINDAIRETVLTQLGELGEDERRLKAI